MVTTLWIQIWDWYNKVDTFFCSFTQIGTFHDFFFFFTLNSRKQRCRLFPIYLTVSPKSLNTRDRDATLTRDDLITADNWSDIFRFFLKNGNTEVTDLKTRTNAESKRKYTKLITKIWHSSRASDHSEFSMETDVAIFEPDFSSYLQINNFRLRHDH